MVNFAIKKKVSIDLENRINQKIKFDKSKYVKNKNIYYTKNPFSDALIHYYCTRKKIKSPINMNLNCDFLQFIKPIFKNELILDNKYPINKQKLVLKILIKKLKNCNFNYCGLCRPVKKFICQVNLATKFKKGIIKT